MQKIINRIIEIEQEAQKLSIITQKEKEILINKIEKDKTEMHDITLDRAKKRNDIFEKSQKEMLIGVQKEIQENTMQKKQQIDDKFALNRQKWEDDIFNSIIFDKK